MQGFSIKSILIWDSNSKMEPYLSIISLLRDKNKILLQLSFLNNMAYLSRVFLVLLQLYRKWCSNKASFCRADVLLKVAPSQNIFPSSKKCAKSQILNFFSIQVKNFRILIDLAHSLDNGKTFRDLCLALLQESVKIQLGRSFKKFTVTSLDYTHYRFIRNGV